MILEVMSKSYVASYEAFKDKVKASEANLDGDLLTYESIYGDKMTFNTSGGAPPTINGEPIDYSPKMVFESPFLNAEWNNGVVTVSKGKRKKVLDFTED